ncbi:lysozyme [Streptantibioticus silvisoli]|uniref:Lysozyme n=1 Tax=Streptantibioticus silvisoli TaxID=2705255 RepID=A0ABT6W7U4_9ACTN|nr:lysozyme [Streptantibioticus silvisoli]MDI5966826.1 lysozyme [Streptantibioticus silvisoli]
MKVVGSSSRRRSAIRRSIAVAGAAAGLVGLVLTVPGSADAAAPVTHAATAHNDNMDWLGSSVAAHEGGDLAPSTLSPSAAATQTPGMDVSHYQGAINWSSAYSNGARFVYMKATEGTDFQDPDFSANYTGSYNAGFIRGSYHFATPDTSTGAAQADYFVAHGGGWSKDGKTLPPMLDIEYGSSSECYGLSQASMVSWIKSFVNEVHAKTTRWPTIYSTTDWWTTCTGNSSAFSSNDPLFIARYASSVGTLPAGWGFYTFWQFADSGTFPGDQDKFNGAQSGLVNLANNT